MPKKSLERGYPGLALSEEVRKKAEEQGISSVDFAGMIGLSPSYTNSLMGGSRPWDGTDRATKLKIAKFLGVPLINVLMLAGIVEPSDFMCDDSIDALLDSAYIAIKSDKTWGGLCPSKEEWASLPSATRILIAILYERATEKEILKKARMIEIVKPQPAARKTRATQQKTPGK